MKTVTYFTDAPPGVDPARGPFDVQKDKSLKRREPRHRAKTRQDRMPVSERPRVQAAHERRQAQKAAA